MTFFKPFKNHPNGPPAPPPAPPRWIGADTNGRSSWPEDDFDNGDVYEPPPYERTAIKVETQPTNLDLIYLDHSSDQPAPQRPAAPPPRPPVQPQRRGAQPQRPPRQCDPQRPLPPAMAPAGPPPRPIKLTPSGKVLPPRREAEVFHDSSITNPPEVDRQEKPGKSSALNKFPPPPFARPPLPSPAPDTEEDVYVDPNEEQGDSDGVYLKPTPSLPLPSPAPMRLPPPISPMVAPPGGLMKPPVPRTTNNSLTTSVTEMKPAPDGKRPMLALPPQKDSKPRIPSPPTVDQIPGVFPKASSTGMKSTKATGNEDNEWFTSVSTRKYAEDLLLRINKDGAFLIRPSSSQDPRQPYTLAVLYREKVYNIPIRFVVEMQGYALGKVGKDFEDTFPSLQDIIAHHKKNQLVLIDSMSQAMHKTYLVHPARP
ncbi:B-cell linker protein isoform X1 [Gadus morhua]|uniref:Si:dkeyp-117b11.1 n=1 Tax=Gadus morhua TaxID=8049 RepID=A0A8C5APD3_GADMO|nr:B-cell linker protein-like isoform X1 [Gadus morhua]